MDQPRDRTTTYLVRSAGGDRLSTKELFAAVYGELRRIAHGLMTRERSHHTLQPTAIVHEAYLKLIDQTRVDWRSRTHFLAVSSLAMRRILSSYGRDRKAQKRGGDCCRVQLTSIADVPDGQLLDGQLLFDLLWELADADERKARLVELKVLAGMTNREAAEALGVSTRTVDRDWIFVRAWILRRIESSGGRDVP
ncbi:MAG: helix-turn-helix domain-containing protein [Planctomycetes bacterium]|nr:helix-turn-helix domain-containing protein [Planctomycetota bacterium]